MTKPFTLPTIIAGLIGLAATLLLLFAWHLPPFSNQNPYTENAYLRGKVTALSPQLSGYLSEVLVTDFQQVTKGDLIARIDPATYRQKVAQAEAAQQSAQANLQIAKQNVSSTEAGLRADIAALDSAHSVLATAQTNATRSRALTQHGTTSQQSADQVELTLRQAHAAVRQAEAAIDVQKENILTAKAQVEARQTDIAQTDAAVALAKIDLGHTEIRAPEDGRLGQVSARVGQYVTAGTTLVSHVGRDLWVIANFKETELKGMKLGDKAVFRVDALSGAQFDGVVEAFSPATASEFSVLSGSNATGNFTKIAQRLPVRISIDADQPGRERLAPGMSVELTAHTTN